MRSSHCWLLCGVDWHGEFEHHDTVETIGIALCKTQRGRAAHRKTAEMCLFDRQRIEERQRVVKERVVRIAACRRIGAAVAALIVAQYLEFIL